MTSVEQFIAGNIAYAKSLSLPAGIEHLKGFLEIASGTGIEPAIRRAHSVLRECDQQLELIASGQLKLDLESTTKRRNRR